MRFYISAPFFKTHFILTAFSITTLLLLTACGGGGGGGGGVAGVVGLSQHGSTNSHTDSRRGTDCMDCHTSGPGTGVFITAGTATSTIGGYIEYYSSDTLRNASTLVAKLQIDAYGNFYTVTPIDALTPSILIGGTLYSPGAYVTVVTSGGSKRNMSGIISHTNSGCNECHNNTVGPRPPL